MRFTLSWPRRRRRPLAPRDRLGTGLHAGGLAGMEMFERRMALAADLAVAVAEVDAWYVPGTQVSLSFDLVNKGDATATAAQFTSALSGQITSPNWTATYAGGATGPASAFGNLSANVTLPAGSSARFTVVGTIGANATGSLVSSVNASLPGDGDTSNNSAVATMKFVPKSIVATNEAAWASTSIVRLLDPATGGTRTTGFAFEPGFKGGVRAALGDLDGDGKPEIVCVPGVGRTAEIAVLRQDVSDSGAVTLSRDTRFTVAPFGAGERRGLNVAVGDFTGDGNTDVAVAKASGAGDVRLYRSTGRGLCSTRPSPRRSPVRSPGSLSPPPTSAPFPRARSSMPRAPMVEPNW
ncbi:MAG: VCBS repeat-containing protein [Planctomycetia bacterium]|nr:VCBS repeat-containing protein [Planctomycetia bacterium]